MCSDESGTIIDDTLCTDEGGVIFTLNEFQEDECENFSDILTADGFGCIVNNDIYSYTYSDSLYISGIQTEYDIYEVDCILDGGTYNANESSCTYNVNFALELIFDGTNNASFNQVYFDNQYEEDSYCHVFTLTKQ